MHRAQKLFLGSKVCIVHETFCTPNASCTKLFACQMHRAQKLFLVRKFASRTKLFARQMHRARNFFCMPDTSRAKTFCVAEKCFVRDMFWHTKKSVQTCAPNSEPKLCKPLENSPEGLDIRIFFARELKKMVSCATFSNVCKIRAR